MDDTGFVYSGTELESFSQADNYYRWILGTMAPYLHGRVLEIGAGLGTVGDRLWNREAISELVLLEPAENLYADLAQRFSGRPNVITRQGYFGQIDLGDAFDAIVVINVLEHVKDDHQLLQEALDALVPGGALLLFAPAMPFLFGTLDRQFEHFRRYRRPALRALLESIGFRLESLRYMHAVGVIGWLLAGRVLRRRTIAPASMRLYDRVVIPWVSRVESWVPPPFGQSLLAVALKPERS